MKFLSKFFALFTKRIQYAQITVEEWERYKLLTEQAHTCAVNSIPDSGICATKANPRA